MSILSHSGAKASAYPIRQDWVWMTALLIVALLLMTVNLGGVPLRDWDEGTVAQVAREIWRSPPEARAWLFPTLGGEPYLNKPPLMHCLMAIAYGIGGVSEWTSRLPGAILTALSVPLLYAIGRELFPGRLPSLLSALVYLTWLPVVRNGRLAMLDGAVLCWLLLLMWCGLRSRRDTRFALGIGLSLGLICLTKGLMLGLLLGSILLVFLIWDTPRLLQQPYLWAGIALGSAPVAFWYAAQWGHYGREFLGRNLVQQSASRIWKPVEQNDGPPWYYLLEVVKYGVPWVVFLPAGIRLAQNNLIFGWAKLALVWSGLYFAAISLMSTKLPWYVLPLYPALALLVGGKLADLWREGRQVGVRQMPGEGYSPLWWQVLGGLGLLGWIGAVYLGWIQQPREVDVGIVMAALAAALTVAAVLVRRQNPQFIGVLIWGMYLSLLLLMLTPHWLWELAEAFPVQPVAALVRSHTPAGETVYSSYGDRRPSLEFYSDRRVLPANAERLQKLWTNEPQVYLLLDEAALKSLELPQKRVLGQAEGFTLVQRVRPPAQMPPL
ncbi:glycosyltransferase family 39 protein [Thermoleptolyngbya sp. M55_K2018_002]|uniref:ArnT family glycosyltransferase n=1 Tax=Thermoleptolyngbya sp. M55_K2018_002 TaxID=2747808 RepID=UPI0019E6A4F4|nr:glycosyltransferase family 39 protein [Thermoleptolyngbya sp. M55_K2018_002]HIK40000.1 glycosyltransferase family 39 protein [Thermoleptolyngbya sp. M55_K2018_002]